MPALIIRRPWLAAVAPLPALITPLPVNRFPNKLDSSSYLTISMIPIIASFEIISVVIPNPNIFLWIAATVSVAAAVNLNGIRTLLANF